MTDLLLHHCAVMRATGVVLDEMRIEISNRKSGRSRRTYMQSYTKSSTYSGTHARKAVSKGRVQVGSSIAWNVNFTHGAILGFTYPGGKPPRSVDC